MSENSYLRHFSAEVSQIVFLANFTVSGLLSTIWAEMSEDSYLRHFSAQISQIMFLASLTVLRLLQLYELKCQNTYISSISVHKFNKSCSQLIWPLYRLLQLYVWKSQKTRIAANSVQKCHKSCS